MQHRNASKAGATCAIAGAALLLVGTYPHPMEANPNEPVAAFTEYAADDFWVASHLMQLAGVASMVAALLFLTTVLETRRGPGTARVAAGGAIASLALAAALQAVDGIALKNMVDAWAAAPASQKGEVFHAAFAVRQIEVGLASMLILSFGLTASLYGAALNRCSHLPNVACGARHGIGHSHDCFGYGDGILRFFWTLDGDQYAGERHPSGLDAHPWGSHVAPKRSVSR